MTYVTAARLAALEARLSERDRLVTQEVSRLRLLSGSQLRRLAFGDVDRRSAQRQLRRLVGLGVLARLQRRIGGVRAGSDGSVYELDIAGQRLVTGWASAAATGRAHRRPEPGQRFAQHTLACSELFVRLVEASRDGGVELLEHQAEPACWRRRVGAFGRATVLRPDAFVRLGVGDRELWWFVEIDRATESLPVIRAQAGAYLAHFRSGVEAVMPRVAWLAPDDHRAGLLGEALHGLGGISRDLFVTGTHESAVRVLTGEQS